MQGEAPPAALGAALGTVNIKVGRQDRHSGAHSRHQPDSCAMFWGSADPGRDMVEVGVGGCVRDQGLAVLGSTVRKREVLSRGYS